MLSKLKSFLTLGSKDEVGVVLTNGENGKCRVVSSITGIEICQMPYDNALDKFKNIVVDNYEERMSFFDNTDLFNVVLRATGMAMSGNEVSLELREFNNFEMPISHRKRLILSDFKEQDRFVKHLKEKYGKA